MLGINDILKKHEFFCSDESKRVGKKRKDSKKEETNKTETEKIETSFRTLDFD